MSTDKEDSQYLTRVTERDREMHLLRRQRQQTGHRPYAAIAAALGSTAALVWGNILREAAVAEPTTPNRGYLAFLSAAIVLGVGACASTAAWMTTRVNQRLNAESDRLREYDNERLVKNLARQIIVTAGEKQFSKRVADEVTRQLDARDRAAKQKHWETFFCDTGTAGPGAPPQQPQQQPRGTDPVIPFPRRPGSARSSG